MFANAELERRSRWWWLTCSGQDHACDASDSVTESDHAINRAGAILDSFNFLALHSVLTNAVPRVSILRMHTGLWKASSRNVMGILTRAAHPSTRPLFQTITSRHLRSKCRGMLPLDQPFCASTSSPYSRLRNASRIPITVYQPHTRHISWTPKLNPRPVEFNGLSDQQEDAAKAAILEKVMKGRQPTDLMLRCKLSLL